MSITKGLESIFYNDPAIYAGFKEKLFFASWQYACHSSQIAEPGDYFSFSLFDQDIMLTRDKQNNLHAFYNVCQHRGHSLVEGCGNKSRLVCPYHAWTYDLSGQLLAAPNSHRVSGFDAQSIRIPQIGIENFLGFIFVNLNNEAESMDTCYPDVKEAILKHCPDIEERQFAYEHQTAEGCNWIVAVENYNECYHCKGVHPQFAKGIIDPNSYRIQPFGSGKVLRHHSAASQSDNAWYDVSGADYASFFLWPSTSIQLYPGGLINNYYWRPLAVDDVCVHRGWFSADGAVDDTLQKVIDLDRDTTFAEDLQLVKRVQRGLQSRGYKPGPLIIDDSFSIDSEASIAALHQWVREAAA